nr:unnamed protein product [Digitaria exilis]
MAAHASMKSSDHWQFRMRNTPALRLVQDLASNTRRGQPWTTRLWPRYRRSGRAKSMSVSTASESTHHTHSASGWATMAARIAGILAQYLSMDARSSAVLYSSGMPWSLHRSSVWSPPGAPHGAGCEPDTIRTRSAVAPEMSSGCARAHAARFSSHPVMGRSTVYATAGSS